MRTMRWLSFGWTVLLAIPALAAPLAADPIQAPELRIDRLKPIPARAALAGLLARISADELFQGRRSRLRPGATARLQPLARAIRAHAGARVLVAVHTDARGLATRNQALSQSRADAVRRALIGWGVRPDQLVAVGVGESVRRAAEDDPRGGLTDRRVELRVLDPR